MGMSTHVIGFKPPDKDWKRMKQVWDSCTAAGIDPPKEVLDFFEGAPPDDAGVEVDLEGAGVIKEWSDDSCAGYDVDVAKLPPDVKVVRFYNAW